MQYILAVQIILVGLGIIGSSFSMGSPVGGRSTGHGWIRINQVGYLPDAVKVSVLCSTDSITCPQFHLYDVAAGELVWSSKQTEAMGAYGPFVETIRLDFTSFQKEGGYFLVAGEVRSPTFKISDNIYDGTADFLLQYMRQQRCGFNPFLNDSCHTRDGYTLYGPMADGIRIDATGGWHDASDYLKYSATSANATFQMLLAYRDSPSVFADRYDASGMSLPNGIPDVLDEARWGLNWLVKMHPRDEHMFNQVADDRDHAGFRLPTADSVNYGHGLERPVYFCSGDPQGLFEHQNRSTGVASTAGKFSSAFALGSLLCEHMDSDFAGLLRRKALSAYRFGQAKPGVCQTAPCRAPYFYEEDNWVDDMELAAAELFSLTAQHPYLEDALEYSRGEKISPWLGANTARHYQWYPFVNIGHYELAEIVSGEPRSELIDNYRQGIEMVWQRGKENAFLMGVPFIWCSNNLVAAFATQCYLYRRLSGDNSYLELEAAMRDWLLGCNPWGVSMVIGLPPDGICAQDPHSAFTHLCGHNLYGGLLDGPVSRSIYKNLKHIRLEKDDEYSVFQSDVAVYHDDVGDYSTNEPTMDGTATLIYYFAAIAAEAQKGTTP